MEMSPVLSPSGEPIFTAGGNHAWKVATHRGWVVSLEWAKTRRKHVALMVIWPEGNILSPGAVANGMWAISRNCITEFVGFTKEDKCTGTASVHCIREATEALPILGKDRNDKQALLSLVDAVIKFAPDLVLMPVAPPCIRKELNGPALWEVTAKDKNTGKVIAEAEV